MTFVPKPLIPDHPALGRTVRYEFQPYNRGTGVVTEVREGGRLDAVTVTGA